MDENNSLPKYLMVLVALLQGLCLLLLHEAIELEFWPHNSPQWLFAFYSFSLIFPTMLLLSLTQGRELALLKWLLPYALLATLLGFYIGRQVMPVVSFGYGSLLPAFVLCMSIATFKVLMYVQQWANGETISYSGLFRWSWRNFLTLGLSLAFACCVWAILMLWGALFKALDIDFFMDLFTERWFFYPAIALANGFGVIIFRSLTQVIDTIRRIQQALMKFLLVLLVFVSMLFLTALPFTGLAPLWDSGGSTLILWMQALMLFFVNAFYQDEPDNRPYALWLHRFIYAGVALLPIYSAISLYGLSLRVDQYGWTVARSWGFLIWFLLALFPLGYLWGIAKRTDDWLFQLSRVNVVMGLVVLAAVLLANSPLLDFRKISVASQIARLDSGEVSLDDFDLRYFYRSLGRPGHRALERLKTEYADVDSNFVLRIDAIYSGDVQESEEDLKAGFLAALQQPGEPAPEALIEEIFESQINRWSVNDAKGWYLVPLDANADGVKDYLFVTKTTYRADSSKLSYFAYLYFLEDGEWQRRSFRNRGVSEGVTDEFFDALMAGDIKLVAPRWPDMQIGDQRLEVAN